MFHELEQSRCTFLSLRDAIDLTTASGRLLMVVLAGVAALLAAVLAAPLLRNLFGFGVLHWDALAISAASAIVVLMGLEWAKRRLWHPGQLT